MKSQEYWKSRFIQLEDSLYSSADKTFAFIDEQYKEAFKEIERQIAVWYSRIARNNSIDIREAKKFLNNSELEEFKWDVQEYIEYGKQNALDKQWMKELENASAKFHISRLEALKVHTRMSCEKLFGKQLEISNKYFKNTYLNGYYHSIYEIQKGLNIGWNIAAIDDNKLSKIIDKPWTTDGKNFSNRIWSNRANLISELHKQLTQDILLGRALDTSINAIAKKFNTSKNQAGRLVMTESAYFSSQSQKDCFNELDIEKFEVVETLDGHTCDICGSMDGKVCDMKDFEPGITAPPFHPWCRGCTVPYFDDNYTERAARDAEGEVYYVPSDMKYSQWKEAFVADSISDQTKKKFAKYEKVLGNKSPTLEEFAKIKYNEDEWKMFKAFTSSIKSGELSALADFDLYKEISREMDEKLLGVVTSNNFTIIGKSNHSIARVIGSIEQRRNGVQVSDILDALTNKDSEILPVKEMKNGKSQKFRNKVVEVSVNPDTGIIIQVNPVHKRRKKVES